MKRTSAAVVSLLILAGPAAFAADQSLRSPGAAALQSDESQRLITQDQQKLDQAQYDYKDAVMRHGRYSDQAVSAQNAISSAQNRLDADRHNAQAANSLGTETLGTTTEGGISDSVSDTDAVSPTTSADQEGSTGQGTAADSR